MSSDKLVGIKITLVTRREAGGPINAARAEHVTNMVLLKINAWVSLACKEVLE